MPKHLTVDDTGDFVQSSQIGAASGVAPLGSDSKIPSTFLPASSSAVTSVNALTGDVVITPNSIGAVPNSSVGNPSGIAPLDSAGRLPVGKLPLTAVQSVNGYSGPSVSLTLADLGGITQSTADGRYMRQDSIVYNAKEHGAVINGTTDDAPAINSILSTSPAGSVVLLPPGDVAINSPIIVPPGKTLMGMHSNLMKVPGLYDPVVRIKPLSTFTGAAAILFVDQATGGYASVSGEQRLIDIMIHGASGPAALDGIQAKGNIQNVVMYGVTVRDMTGNGIYTGVNAGAYPYSWRLHRVMLDNNHGHGLSVTLMTDLTMVDCQAIGNWSNGFVLSNVANSQLTTCRAEWNGNHGYYITGSWGTGTGSGGMQMSNCGTDRNGWHGVFVDATGNAPIVISNLMTRRDGRNGNAGGGGYAGLCATSATVPLTIGDWNNYPGVDDNGTGTNSPQYGGSFTGNTSVQIDNAYLHANTAGLYNGGTNTSFQLGANIMYATGPTTAPVRTAGGGVVRVDSLVHNVKDYGAKGDDTADDAPAFQAAINASAQGDVVYVPPGKYRLASTVVLTLGVTLRGGGWSPHFIPRTNMNNAFLRPGIGNFVGTELIRVDPAPVGGSYLDSALGGGPRIEGLALNGRSQNNVSAGAITGIKISAGVKDVQVRRVSIWQFTGDAILSDDGAGMVFDQVVCSTNSGVGFNLLSLTSGTAGATDVDMINCYSQGHGGDGFVLANPNAVTMTGCRSEFNAGHGYTFTGLTYSLVMTACNTDRSGKHGFNFLTLDGGKPPLLVGCQAKRDGATGTYAGFNFQGTNSTTQSPGGVLQGCSAYVGRNDDNSGSRTPSYGVQTLFARRVQMSGGWIEGSTSPYNDSTVAISKTSGIVQVTIDPSTGTGTISNSDRMDINGSPGANRAIRFFSRGSGQRWETRANSTSEAGSNAGSDYEIARWSDAGAEIDVPFRITRSTGVIRFTKPPVLNNTAFAALGWLSVKDYGAVGDAITDDTTAIQAALTACPAGGVVYMPAGVYRTSAPVSVPPYVTLRGVHGGGEAQSTSAPAPSCIKPLSSFAGAAVVQVLDQQLGGYATISSEVKIQDLTILGSSLVAASVAGIQMKGQIQHITLRDVQVRQVTGNAFDTAYNLSAPPGPQAPFCLHFERLSALWAAGTGFALNNSTDSVFTDCYALGCSSWGWYIAGVNGGTWMGCRAEWSGTDGFFLATNTAVQTFIGCSTDRNGQHGFNIGSSTSTGTIVLSGCRMTRDGRTSTTSGYAGLNVASTTRKVFAEGLLVTTGRDDDGVTGNLTPQYGVSVASSSYVVVASGDINGVGTAWHDGGGNTTLLHGAMVTGSDITSWTWAGTGSNISATAGATVFQTSVAADTQQRYTLGADGKQSWGSGSATPDTVLSRVGAAILNLAGTFRATLGAVGTAAYSALVTGDTSDRWHVNANGKHEWGPGNAAIDTNLYRSSGGALQTDGFFAMGSGQSSGGFSVFTGAAKALTCGTAGGGLSIKEGTNARMNTAVLNGTTAVTVANTSVSATSRIFLTIQTPGGTVGSPYVSAVTAGTSFQIKSTVAGDTSTVAYFIVEPA